MLTGCGTLSGALRVDSVGVAAPAAVETVAPREPEATRVVARAPAPPLPAVAESSAPAVAESAAVRAGAPVATDGESVVAAAGAAAVESVAQPTPPATLAEPPQDNRMAQAREQTPAGDEDAVEEPYDPWEPFNDKMFEFNRRLDRYVLKPVAKAYNFVVPDQLQIMISNGFDNIAFPPRFVNSVLQGKFKGAGREIGRFLLNSTIGVGGLFDPAKDVFGLVKSREDFGQTLGFYGVGPGPYLIMPFLEPLTVRDGIGKAVDSAMDPLAYYLPLIWDRLGMKVGDTINERSLNLDLFQGFEESVIDMYSAVRHGYLQRREKLIRE
jgi:phospholipid-binding lipoprotein MlaA